jgi:hypothetical protein
MIRAKYNAHSNLAALRPRRCFHIEWYNCWVCIGGVSWVI